MILEEIAEKTRVRVAAQKKKVSLEGIRREAEALPVHGPEGEFPFYKALMGRDISFICEVKKASPSKGVIAEEFPYLEIAKDYEQAGASAISVLTEPDFFQGKDEYLKEIAQNVSIPVLRKDFTIDAYQIYEARVLGASAVLLICSILEEQELTEYLHIAHSLGLSALVEAHTQAEVEKALRSKAGIIGVNNRDLKTFQVDINTSARLRRLVPEHVIYVSESGIRTRADIEVLEKNGTNAVLIGEAFMRSTDKKKELDRLRGYRGGEPE